MARTLSKEMTPKQAAILAFITERAGHGLETSLRDIATKFGFASHTGATAHIKYMIRKGVVFRDAGGKIKVSRFAATSSIK